MKNLEQKGIRTFGGNFNAIIQGKTTKEGMFEKKHLKAYLKGKVGFGRYNSLIQTHEFTTIVNFK